MVNSAELREGILQKCFRREDTLFSSGETANNKINMELLVSNSDLTDEVVRRLGRLVSREAADFVVGVPNGANWLAELVADRTRMHLMLLHSDADKTISFEDSASRVLAERSGLRGVLVEDVFNRFTATRRVLDFEPVGANIVSAVSVWDRGDPSKRQDLEIPYASLITEHIPEHVLPESELWIYCE